MSRKLNDITLYYSPTGERAKKFTVRQNLISSLYTHFLGSYKPLRTSRISITLDEIDSAGEYFGSILSPSAKFDKELYWKLSEGDKNRVILETIHRVVLLCAKKYGWDITVFENAHVKVLKSNFRYEIEKQKKQSKDKKYKAAIQVSKNLDSTTISVAFYDKSNNFLKSVEILKSFQHEMFYGKMIRNSRWFNNTEFGIYTTNDELIIKAALDSDKSKTIITPKTNTRKELENRLKQITYREIDGQDDLINWANR